MSKGCRHALITLHRDYTSSALPTETSADFRKLIIAVDSLIMNAHVRAVAAVANRCGQGTQLPKPTASSSW